MKKLMLIPLIFASLISCNRDSDRNSNGYSNKKECESKDQSDSSDWAITARVKKAIMTDGSLSASAKFVSVTTNNGVVTLSGNVPSKEESKRIVNIVKSVRGVSSVDNQMNISN